jgi:Putative addiction module component
MTYNHNMEHTTVPEPPGFHDLPKKQQVLYVQALWDSISDSDDSIPVLESQLRVAEDRLRALEQNPESAVCARQMLEDVTKASS